MDILIKLAEKEDLQAILEIQYLAFQKEAKKFNDYNIEPLQQTIASLEEEFKIFTFLKALDEHGKIIGSTRGYVKENTSYIGKTVVHPNFQGHGIGSKLITELEKLNPAHRNEINASIRCPQNIRLYEQLNFKRFKEIKTENNGFVYLEKSKKGV
ncbi:MAG TPA: GNAT family N-acetyltransferase [Lachnospiraceae bacterium]|nr:GNAT family N-acetyltransferase [Lachnospiraceae bacterium]